VAGLELGLAATSELSWFFALLQEVFLRVLQFSPLLKNQHSIRCRTSLKTTFRNAVVVILAGFLIDKVGNPIGTLLFSFLCLAGTSLFAAGLYCKGNPSMMFLLFLLGRLLLGSGNGSLIIIQSRMSAVWFKDKELAFSFGCILAFSRLASGLNFFLTESFEEKYDLHWTLWGGAILCGFGCVCAIITSILDAIGLQQMEEMTELKIDSKNMVSMHQ